MKLIGYLSNGYPSLAASRRLAALYIEAGVDIVEIDSPAKDPCMEGRLIQERMQHALDKNPSHDDCMASLAKIKETHPEQPFILLIYAETIATIGRARFAAFCARSGFEDIILTGAATQALKDFLMAAGVNVSAFVRFELPEEDILAAKRTNGFLYVQAKAKEASHPRHQTLAAIIKHLREDHGFERPIHVGVGIADDEEALKEKIRALKGAARSSG